MFKKGLIWIGASLLFNILETWFFGWNAEPESSLETYCDLVAALGIMVGLSLVFGYAVGKTARIRIEERREEDHEIK